MEKSRASTRVDCISRDSRFKVTTFHFCAGPLGRVSITETLITQFPSQTDKLRIEQRPESCDFVIGRQFSIDNRAPKVRFARPIFIFLPRSHFFLCLYQSNLLFVVADKLYKPVSNIRAGTRSVKIRFFYIFFRLSR